MSTMGEVRQAVGDALRGKLPADCVVIDWPQQADQADAHRVTIGADRILPPSVACPVRRYQVVLFVVTPFTDPGPADDDLDTLCEATLTALDDAGYAWSEAVRTVWLDSHHAYEISLEVIL